MGKVTHVKKSRKEFTCSKCRQVIPVGSEYYRGELNFQSPIIRCSKCGLQSWEVTTSDYQLRIGEILYRLDDNYDLSSIDCVDEIISELNDISSELEDKLGNMPESLQDSDSGTLLQDRIDCIECVVSELTSFYDSFDPSDIKDDEDMSDIGERLDEILSQLE